jgi:hypothetical protein
MEKIIYEKPVWKLRKPTGSIRIKTERGR